MEFLTKVIVLLSLCIVSFYLISIVEGVEGNCKFEMKRIPGLNPIVRTDENGRSCRGDILLPSCMGACKTQEYGTHVFPYRESVTVACTLLGNKVKNISLSDCDEGADESIRFLTVSDSTNCGCQELPPKN